MDTDSEVDRINQKKLEGMMKRQSTAAEKQPDSDGKPVVMTDSNFVEVVKKYPVVVVDFWAPWCGPCRMVSPVLEEMASEMSGSVTFGKLNVDENPATSQRFGIQGIPTIMVFKDGQPVDGIVGAAPKQMIEARIRPYVGGETNAPYR